MGAAEFELGEGGFVPVVEEGVGGLFDFFWREVFERVSVVHGSKVTRGFGGSRRGRDSVAFLRARMGGVAGGERVEQESGGGAWGR